MVAMRGCSLSIGEVSTAILTRLGSHRQHPSRGAQMLHDTTFDKSATVADLRGNTQEGEGVGAFPAWRR